MFTSPKFTLVPFRLRRVCMTSIFLAVTLLNQAQDLASDMKKMNLSYIQTAKYKISITYSLFLDNKLDSKTETGFRKDGSNWYFNMEGNEVIKTGNYYISLNHNDKVALVRKNFQQQVGKNDILKIDFEALVKTYKNVSRSVKGNIVHYEIEIKSGLYKTLIVEIDSRNSFLTYLKLFYRDPYETDQGTKKTAVIEINISTDLTSPPQDPSLFSVSKYLLISGKKLMLKSPWSGYKLLIYDDKKK